MFNLKVTPLRFECEATTPLRLEVDRFRAGNNLRGAMGSVMRRAYCASPPAPSPVGRALTGEGGEAHAATCPVCWLLAANERPGQERRGYALIPPRREPESGCFEPGGRFEFGLTLFGEARRFLPYFILTVPEMGRMGVGAGRGQFALRSVWAVSPFTGERECLLAEGDSLVHTPTMEITHEVVEGEAQTTETALAGSGRLTLKFVTPMRLVHEGQLVKAADFGVFFARLLKRLDELEEQFGGGGRRPLEEVAALQSLADRVRLVAADTRWVEVRSGSTRRGQPSWISGLVGAATYSAPIEVWRPLLPWLLWGQVTQVGKDVVKGNGVLEVGG